MKEWNKEYNCIMQPNNVGLLCVGHNGCASCGWNPRVHAERLKEYIEKHKKEKEKK